MYRLALTPVKHVLEESACAALMRAVTKAQLLRFVIRIILSASAQRAGMHAPLLVKHATVESVVVVKLKAVKTTRQLHIVISILVDVHALKKERLVMLEKRIA